MPATLLQKRTSSLADRQELGQIVYCVAIALLLILSEVFSSSIQNTLPAFSRFARMALSGASLGLLGIKCLFLTRYESLVQWVILVAAGLYAAFAGAHGGDTWFLLAVLVGLGAKNVDLRRTLKVYLITAVAGLVLVQLLHFPSPFMPATGITATAIITDTEPGSWAYSWCGAGCAGHGCAGSTGQA